MRAVITVIGKDMVGILARVSAQCAGHGINVLEVTQSILQDMFAMIMMVDISNGENHWNFGAGDTPARKGTGTLCSTPTIYWKPSP